MKVYRLYTENKNRDWIEGLADRHLTSYTLYVASGRFEGKSEPSIIIEVISDSDAMPVVMKALAARIKYLNEQQEVWITSHDIDVSII